MFALCLVITILVASSESVKNQIPSARDVLLLARNGYDPTDKAYRQQRIGLELSTLDDENYIERPCEVYDVNCIRKYFVKNSRCYPSYGPAPDPLYRPQLTLHLPRINLTLTSLKTEYRGINGRIIEFYVNKKTDKLVLSVDFDNFRFGSNENYFTFHRVGREPIVNRDFFNVTYISIGSTIIIPNLKDLQLQDSEVFSYSNTNALPTFVVGPNTFAGTDPQLLLTAVEFLASLATNIKEGYLLDIIGINNYHTNLKDLQLQDCGVFTYSNTLAVPTFDVDPTLMHRSSAASDCCGIPCKSCNR